MIDATGASALMNDRSGAEAGDATASVDVTFVAEDGIVRLSVAMDSGSRRLIIRQAQHTGSVDALTGRVLDRFCTIIAGRPLQEAADHGAIYTAAALPDDCAAVPGIRTPRNAGPAFELAERLIRKVHAAARHHFGVGHRENAWYLRPDADWLAKNEAEQATRIKPIVAGFLRTSRLAEGDVWICRIERGTRVTIAFSDSVSYAAKPELMMVLEQRLRRETGNPIELFMEEMKDANRIRRL